MSNNLIERAQRVLNPALGRYFPNFAITRAKGMFLYGTDGKKYLDFSSGIAAANTGHCHPKVVRAILAQAKKLIHICAGVAYYEQNVALAEKLKEIAPRGLDLTFFTQSGAEANECAIKLARYYTKRAGLIAFQGAFHGRTMGSLSLTTSKMKYREGYDPLLPEVYIVERDLKEVKKLDLSKMAAIIIELIMGEGGYIPNSPEFIRGLREICDQNGILLIFDEVQTGFGRTGKMFASEHYGVAPDIMTLAKGIASGLPLGACIATKAVAETWPAGAHGSTMTGNPVACAAALATIEVLQSQKLAQNAAAVGEYLVKKLKKLKRKYPVIKDIRGMGLMIGVDIGNPEIVKNVMAQCLEDGLVLISTGGDGTVLRFIPPLIVKKTQINKALKIFEGTLKAL